MDFPIKNVIFHCYVSSPEGKPVIFWAYLQPSRISQNPKCFQWIWSRINKTSHFYADSLSYPPTHQVLVRWKTCRESLLRLDYFPPFLAGEKTNTSGLTRTGHSILGMAQDCWLRQRHGVSHKLFSKYVAPPCQSIPISSSPSNMGQDIGKKHNTYLHGVFCKYFDDLEQWFPSSKMAQKTMKTAQNSFKMVQKYLLPRCQKRSTAEFSPRCWAAEASGPQTCHDAPAPASHAVSPGGVGGVEGLGGWILYYMYIISYIYIYIYCVCINT